MTKPLYKTFYIPGYPGRDSITARALKDLDPTLTILEYDPQRGGYHVDQMIDQIISQTGGGEHPIIAASSLGGWFAEKIANKIPVDLVLWNPSLKPNMVKYDIPNYRPHRSVNVDIPRTVFLGMMDTVVDPQIAINLYGNLAKIVCLDDTEHRMTNLGIKMIHAEMKDKQWFNTLSHQIKQQ